MQIVKPLAVLFALALAPAAWADGALLKLDPARSSASYKIVHKFHEVEATSRKLEGAAMLRGNQIQVQIRSAIAAFDSGNANRDSHMKETVDEAKFPEVSLKGVVKAFEMPANFPAILQTSLDGQLTFHGVTHPVTLPVKLTLESPSRIRAQAGFDVSLDAYKVDRPSLLFVKIDDACHITADVLMVR